MIPRYRPQGGRLLDRVCPIPDETASYEEAFRLRHLDLAALEDAALRRERRRAIYRADIERAPHPWLAERLAAVEAELRRRR